MKLPTIEEIIEEYRQFFLQEIPPEKEGGVGFVLYCSRCEGSEGFDNWLRTTLTTDRQAIKEALLEEVKKKPVIVNMLQDDSLFIRHGIDGVIGYNEAIKEYRTIINNLL